MKRKSIAEITLQKQIDRIEADINLLDREMGNICIQAQALTSQRDALVTEMHRLEADRLVPPAPRSSFT